MGSLKGLAIGVATLVFMSLLIVLTNEARALDTTVINGTLGMATCDWEPWLYCT